MLALRLTYAVRSFVKQPLLWLMLALLVTWIVPASHGHAQVVAGAANSARVVDPPYGDQPPGESDPPPAYNDARMISQSVPTSVVAGQTYQVSITMQNTGTLPWSQSNKYLLAPQDGSYVWGTTRGELPSSPVLPGATMTIDFPMTAPSTPGTYLFQWRMVQEFVEWFGTPTTAVMVTVTAPPSNNNARMISQSVPTSVVAGQTYPVSITMQNTGTLPWNQSAKYILAPMDGSYVWGTTRGELPSSPVLPGATTTMNFPLTAPSTPGTYLFQWRMVQEFVEWFGTPTTAVMITVTQNLGNVTFIHTDGLGSPVARTDGAGNLISRTYYEPYGNTAAGAQPTIGFTGHVNDVDTGLTYMQQRYYDPVAGRFLSIDPKETDVANGDKFNRYTYAGNSPFNYVDPDGRDATWVARADGTSVLNIKVFGTGVGATPAAMAALKQRVEGITLPGRVTVVMEIRSEAGPGINTLNMSPGLNTAMCGGAGECVNQLGGNLGHIDSSQSGNNNAGAHEVFHFAGISDRYVEGPRTAAGERTSVPSPGYDRTNIMTARGGTTLNQEQMDEAKNHPNVIKQIEY